MDTLRKRKGQTWKTDFYLVFQLTEHSTERANPPPVGQSNQSSMSERMWGRGGSPTGYSTGLRTVRIKAGKVSRHLMPQNPGLGEDSSARQGTGSGCIPLSGWVQWCGEVMEHLSGETTCWKMWNPRKNRARAMFEDKNFTIYTLKDSTALSF